MEKTSLMRLLRSVHDDEQGAVSLETILIIGAIAVPILTFLVVKAWPRVKNYFSTGMDSLEAGSDQAKQ